MLYLLGMYGILSNRRDLLKVLMSVELLLGGVCNELVVS